MSTSRRAYGKVRDIVERHEGVMRYEREGYRYGAWILSLDGKTTVIEAMGKKSFPQLDQLYVPKVSSPTSWEDYRNVLIDDAEERLWVLLR